MTSRIQGLSQYLNEYGPGFGVLGPVGLGVKGGPITGTSKEGHARGGGGEGVIAHVQEPVISSVSFRLACSFVNECLLLKLHQMNLATGHTTNCTCVFTFIFARDQIVVLEVTEASQG